VRELFKLFFPNINSFRVYLSEKVAMQIEKSMGLLGISVPNRM